MSTVDPDTKTPGGAPERIPLNGPPPPAWPAPSPPPPPPFEAPAEAALDVRLHTLGRRIFAASLVAAVAVAGVFVYRSQVPAKWDPLLEPYVAFIEAERGLEFDHPVNVRWTDIAAEIQASHGAPRSNSIFATVGEDQEPAVDPFSEAYRLLGLIDPDPQVGLEAALTETLAENAGAFYEPWTETIVLPEGKTIEELGFVVVHELTHALQHQNGMLVGGLDSADGSRARTALIEGDADRIATAWLFSLSADERAAYFDAAGYDPNEISDDPGDNFLAASFYASYGIGLPMVQALVEAEGTDELNSLLRAKDAGTTERFIDVLGPSNRSETDAVINITLPPGADLINGDLGALTWFQVLAPSVGTEAAFDAVIGYDDDAFAVFRNGDGAQCVRYALFFDSAADAGEFASIIEDAGVDREHIDQTSDGRVEIDLCEPIGDPGLQRLGTILPVIAVNELARVHLENGEDGDLARCAAIAQASTIPADRPLDEFVGWDLLIGESPRFIDGCR